MAYVARFAAALDHAAENVSWHFRLQLSTIWRTGGSPIMEFGPTAHADSPVISWKASRGARQYAGEKLSSPPDSGSREAYPAPGGCMHQDHGNTPPPAYACCRQRLHLA